MRKITGIKKQNKIKRFRTLSDGIEVGDTLTTNWSSQPNPPKVYISGYRIHHGLVGVALVLVGLIAEKPAITGLGVQLALDDIEDMPNWLDFEENNSIQYSNYLPLDTNGFA